MENQTAEIIMICKGRHNYGDNLSFKEAVATYLSDYCYCPIEYISDSIVNDVIWEAALDYLDGLKKPSSFLHAVKGSFELHNHPFLRVTKKYDVFDAVCGAFSMAQVKDDGCYINGFTEENTKVVCKKHLVETTTPKNKE